MNWVRAVCGVVLVFVGMWQAMIGVSKAVEPLLVSIFWGNQTANKRKRAANV